MPIHAIARLIQTMLYSRRFFPFYVYNILGGIEDDGTGAVYSFDPVGSYERETCRAAGAAQSLVQPFLDNQVSDHNSPSDPPVSSIPIPSHPIPSSDHLASSPTNSIPFIYLFPFLDPFINLPNVHRLTSPGCQIYFKNMTPAPGTAHPSHLPLPHVLSLVIDSFTSATERHIEVGDGLEIYVVLAPGSHNTVQGLEGVAGVQELTTSADGERVFVVRRNLKRD